MPKEKYYSTVEVANMLGVSRVTVFNMIRDGRLKAEKVGRNYIVPAKALGIDTELSEMQKKQISNAVKKTVREYGETLKLLADE